MTTYKGKNIRISESTHQLLKKKLPIEIIMSKFVEYAIIEKLERDNLINKDVEVETEKVINRFR